MLNMDSMFYGAVNFNHDLTPLNVSNVKSFRHMCEWRLVGCLPLARPQVFKKTTRTLGEQQSGISLQWAERTTLARSPL